jgi:hypothetical protein
MDKELFLARLSSKDRIRWTHMELNSAFLITKTMLQTQKIKEVDLTYLKLERDQPKYMN